MRAWHHDESADSSDELPISPRHAARICAPSTETASSRDPMTDVTTRRTLMATYSRRQVLGMAGGVALVATAARVTPAAAAATTSWVPAPTPVPVPLDSYFDNDGIDALPISPHDGNFDGSGYTFPGEELPSGSTTVAGV